MNRDELATDTQDIIRECRDRLRLATDAESSNRTEAITDLEFGNGDQWPNDVRRDRDTDARPCLTINLTDAMVRRVVNACRENRPRIKCHAVGDGADVQTAKVIDGMIRHIEVNSSADYAYDAAVESAIRGGWGYLRISSQYIDERSFEQDLTIERVANPFTVYLDPASVLPDGSDANWAIVSDMMSRTEYKAKYGEPGPAFDLIGPGDDWGDWSSKEQIRVAEYWRIERKEDVLYQLSNGNKMLQSEAPTLKAMELAGVMVVAKRPTVRKVVKWYLVTATEILDEREWPGKWIPIIPVYGRELNINGRIARKGMIRDLRDPARMYNYAQTTLTEHMALQPKAPWLIAGGQMEGYEDAWRDANRKPITALPYKPVQNPDGSMAPPPMRQMPPQVASGVTEWAQSTQSDFLAVAGMSHDPGADAKGEVVSGIAIQRRQGLADIAHYDFYDNLVRSLKQVGRILLDLFPHFYDTQRIQRIIRDDGVPEIVTINEKQQNPENPAVMKVKYDLTVGRYDVVIETGPGYQTKRQESAAAMLELLATPLGQMTAQQAGDVVIRSMDFPEASTIADRLAASIPAAQVDEKSDIPPAAQMTIKNLQAQLAQANQKTLALELELHSKHGLEQMRQEGETHRTIINAQTKMHDTEVRARTALEDTHVKAQTAHDVAEIHGATQLLNTHAEAEHNARAADKMLNEATEAEDRY